MYFKIYYFQNFKKQLSSQSQTQKGKIYIKITERRKGIVNCSSQDQYL